MVETILSMLSLFLSSQFDRETLKEYHTNSKSLVKQVAPAVIANKSAIWLKAAKGM